MKSKSKKIKSPPSCPFCNSDNISVHESKETIIDRMGKEFLVENYSYSTCDECDVEFITAVQSRLNEKHFADARRLDADLLPSTKICGIRKKLGLRQEDASKLFGGGANAFSKYELGYVTQSVAMDRLLRLAARYPELVIPFLKEVSGIEAEVPTVTVTAELKSHCKEYDFENSIGHIAVVDANAGHEAAMFVPCIPKGVKSQVVRKLRDVRIDRIDDETPDARYAHG